MKQNLYAWLFEGGIVGVPKRLLAFMEPLGLGFDDLGKIIYLLYSAEDGIHDNDLYAIEAARTLHAKGIVYWYTDLKKVDFSPMFDKLGMGVSGGEKSENSASVVISEMNHGDLVKKIERKMGKFLTLKEREDIELAVASYNWSYDLIYEIYVFYQNNFRKHTYTFSFFCKMAFGAKVCDSASFNEFVKNVDSTKMKVIEVLRRLGKYNNPTAAQTEMYLKWANEWKFKHEVILMAADENLSADNPSFKYLNSVLEEWKKLNLASSSDVLKYKESMKKSANIKNKGKRTENFVSQNRDLNSFIE